MGTDIHWVWEKKTPHGWEAFDVDRCDRNYLLFAWLADVRNGRGFAGVPAHKPITPIAAPRGLPTDTHIVNNSRDDRDPRYVTDEHDVWLGDHSFSWLTGAEILAAPRAERLRRIGVVALAEARACEAEKRDPKHWSGYVWGPKIVVSPLDAITPETTHVQMEWDEPNPLQWFIDEVEERQKQHGEIRVLFGFDS